MCVVYMYVVASLLDLILCMCHYCVHPAFIQASPLG